jgi:chaperonin GroES
MSFNAVQDKVIVKLIKVEETTRGGLVLPDTATSMPDQGTVVAVGPGRYSDNGTFHPTTVEVGDRVVFNVRAAQKIEIEDEEYLIFLNEHILAVITD